MTKIIAFLAFSPKLSRAEAITYYETRHAPLAKSLIPGLADYRRNFLPESVAGFDVVTELWFDSQEDYDTAAAKLAEPDIAKRIAEDEMNVFDRSRTVSMVVDERVTPFP